MALFSQKKTEAKEGGKSATPLIPAHGQSKAPDLAHILKNPRITEKATGHSAAGVYAFDVSENATKRSVVQAVLSLYKVVPRKVRILRVPAKQKRSIRTGARGVSRGGRKAYVYLKKGDAISVT